MAFIFSKDVFANEEFDHSEFRDSLIKYKNFSASITQVQDNQLSLGKINLAEKRIRLDYIDPSEITLIINSKKGMYYNKDLGEVQYFSTKNTEAVIFYDLFYNKFFLEDFEVIDQKISVTYKKKQKIEEGTMLIDIVFEKSPLLLREITLSTESLNVKIGLTDHNFNPIFEKDFFSMADPTLR